MPFDASSFQERLVYEAEAEPAALRADVGRIRGFDEKAERRVRIARCLGPVLLVIAFPVIVGGAGSLLGDTIGPAALIVAGLLLVGLSGGGIYLFGRLKRFDLDDRRYQLLEGLGRLLEPDLEPGRPLSVRLDLEPVDAEAKKTQEDGRRRRWRITHGADEWLQLSGRLADGTKFQLTAADESELRRHGKRPKFKRKTKTTLALRLRPKTKRYDHLDRIGKGGVQGAVALPEGVRLKEAEAREGEVVLKSRIKLKMFNEEVSAGRYDLVEPAAQLFLGAYQVLNLSRGLTRRAG